LAEAYISNPFNLPEVNHKNGDKGDNRIENLEWCTRNENLKHALGFLPISKRKIRRGTLNYWAKLNDKKIIEIRRKHKNGISCRQLGFIYGVSGPTIQGIVKRKYWNHVG